MQWGYRCLCKLAAQLIFKPTALWAQVVKAKYHFFSSIWSKICMLGHEVQFQSLWLIGARESINIYTDPWLSNLPLSAWPTFINMEAHNFDMKLAQLITNNRTWHVDPLLHLFSTKMMTRP